MVEVMSHTFTPHACPGRYGVRPWRCVGNSEGMTWHALEPVDDSFFETADHRYVFPIDLDVPPERVWESLQSDSSVADWGLGVQDLRWTSPRPFGVGTTREVVLPLGLMTV